MKKQKWDSYSVDLIVKSKLSLHVLVVCHPAPCITALLPSPVCCTSSSDDPGLLTSCDIDCFWKGLRDLIPHASAITFSMALSDRSSIGFLP
mmetsp:Transcript_31812/g.46277  ORF Transcript_31812/g.46277 Transcript_31812/m.46277 type:complete len:92 (+) Transcript_31812:542-817(+)